MALEGLLEEKERLMSRLVSITASYSDGGGGGSKDSLGDGVAGYVDLVRRIDDECKVYMQARDDVRAVVREVMHRDIVLGQCLHYRYIEFESPDSCADRMGYEPRHERRLHRKALQVASEAIAERNMSANVLSNHANV